MNPRYAGPAIACLLALLPAGVALADEIQETAVSDADLDDIRGGYISVNGLSFDFGATLTTMIDGQLALQTSINYQPGQVTSVTTPGVGVTPLATAATTVVGAATPLTTAALDQLTGQGASVTQGSLPVYTAANGAVALIQGQTAAGLVNVTLNTQTGQTVVQNTNVTITIPNGAAFQANNVSQSVFNGLAQQIAQNAVTLRH